ncbi:hypothetical protein [Methanocella arvoryzae]|uniref:hypothetical protein n=1 Tax=Methanocella arvoryzae TaxID=1175445 RepID=UPI000322C685|nr:hypothetical protein [Methanocella arvoryzae]
MDGAGTTIFDRIEQKLSAAGAEVDITDLKEAVSQYDAKISENPADTESRIIGLELKLVMLARMLNAAMDVLPSGSAAASASVPETPFDDEASAPKAAPAQAATSNGPKKKRLRQNPATGVIEEIEDTEEDNVIVADGRIRFSGGKAIPVRDEKKCVFINAVDDEAPGPIKKK